MTNQDDLSLLRDRVSAELDEPVLPGVAWLAKEIAAHHGDTVIGVLFYGSCLRKTTTDGVIDYWVIVDDYVSAHESAIDSTLNRFVAPSVYYRESEFEGSRIRTKYGVIDRRAFEQGTSLDAWVPYVWARFAQPARLLEARDPDARRFLCNALANAIVTFVARGIGHMPDQAGLLRFSLASFWKEAFRRTYDSERRPEAEESIRGLYFENEERYDAVASHALLYLATTGFVDEATPHARSFAVKLRPARLKQLRLRWRLMRGYARMIGLGRLLKTAYTFRDWVPYVLYKLEKHTGRQIELTPRQRKHPLIFAWPIIIPLLLRRNLR